MSSTTKEKTIAHPMEEIFDIPSGTTVVEYQEPITTELVAHETYDKKDGEIEEQLQEVFDKAMTAFETQSDISDLVEGRYSARNAEAAVQFLNVALTAVKEKSILKQHKDKLEVIKEKAKTPGKVENNLIVADRNEILKILAKKSDNSESDQ